MLKQLLIWTLLLSQVSPWAFATTSHQHTKSSSSSHTIVIPSSVDSVPISKQLIPVDNLVHTSSSYHRHLRRNHRHRRHGRSHKHPKARAFGSLFATYLATVYIRDDPYVCILDTGSSDFAVAASPECGCDIYYKEECPNDSDIHLSVQYGDGNWTGVPCTDEVSIGKLSLGEITFAGMKTQIEMLECDQRGHQQNGIIGLAFPGLLGPPTNYTRPFFDLLSINANLPAVFALQCCGWQNVTDLEYNAEYAQGALDLGGPNHRHYHGDIYWTPITERLFYAVDLIDVRVNDVSVMPPYRRPADARYVARDNYNRDDDDDDNDGRDIPVEEGQAEREASLRWPRLSFPPQTIVDSGTSNIIFTAELWNATVNAIKALVPPQPDEVWDGDDCIAHSNDGTDITSSWPTLTLVFAPLSDEYVPISLSIPPCRYLAKAPAKECGNGIDGHSFTIELGEVDEGWILGQVVYESFYIIHDNANNRVGFALLDGCDTDSTCVQQATIGKDTQLIRASIAAENTETDDDYGRGTRRRHGHRHHHSNTMNTIDDVTIMDSNNNNHNNNGDAIQTLRVSQWQGGWLSGSLILSVIGLILWCYYWQYLKHTRQGYQIIDNDIEDEV